MEWKTEVSPPKSNLGFQGLEHKGVKSLGKRPYWIDRKIEVNPPKTVNCLRGLRMRKHRMGRSVNWFTFPRFSSKHSICELPQ
jgi:hypothetical protein